MGAARLNVAAALLGAFSIVAAVFAAPVVLNLMVQPDSASGYPGGTLFVVLAEGGAPVADHNVTVHAADGSWSDHCTTNEIGACSFDPLPGAKGRVTINATTRMFFLPEGQTAIWSADRLVEDEGSPLGLGPADAVPTLLLMVANLLGFVAAIALYRRKAIRVALVGVGASLVANLLVMPVGAFAALFAGYALIKDANLFRVVPLDGLDPDEEEE